MPIKVRDKSGKATSRFDERSLYDVVRAVAEHADPLRPAGVTQRKWDAARAGAGYPDAPSARAICMRLKVERTQESFSWLELLEAVFSEGSVVDRIEIRRRSEPPTGDLSINHVYFAVHVVAKRLGKATVRRDEYVRERQEMLAEERRRGGYLLSELLPTRNQLEVAARNEAGVGSRPQASDWDRVLEMVGLEIPGAPASAGTRQPPRGLPFPIVIHHYLEANGIEVWPSAEKVRSFAKLGNFRLPQLSLPWADHLEEARAHRDELGLPSPTLMPADAPREIQRRPVKPPLGPIDGAAPKASWGECIYSDEELQAAVERYDHQAGAGPRTRDGYRAFATAEGEPAAHYLDRIGGFTAAIRRVRERRTKAAT